MACVMRLMTYAASALLIESSTPGAAAEQTDVDVEAVVGWCWCNPPPCWSAAPHRGSSGRQGLTVVHFSVQPKPCWSHLCLSPCLIDWGKIMHPTYPQNVLTLSQIVGECKPLPAGAATAGTRW